MKYKIKIEYTTGNSLESCNRTELLEIEWQNLEIAKKNLKFIKQHYMMNKLIEKSQKKIDYEDLLKIYGNSEWFVSVKNSECQINLQLDNGNYMTMYCYWMGYFEELISAEITIDNDFDDMKFEV